MKHKILLKREKSQTTQAFRFLKFKFKIKIIFKIYKFEIKVWGCSSVVERPLCMRKARGSIPLISTF